MSYRITFAWNSSMISILFICICVYIIKIEIDERSPMKILLKLFKNEYIFIEK